MGRARLIDVNPFDPVHVPLFFYTVTLRTHVTYWLSSAVPLLCNICLVFQNTGAMYVISTQVGGMVCRPGLKIQICLYLPSDPCVFFFAADGPQIEGKEKLPSVPCIFSWSARLALDS
jgi:hypothetical protein